MTPTGATEINPLYDPNFRQFDVEGYRVYRGRTSSGVYFYHADAGDARRVGRMTVVNYVN